MKPLGEILFRVAAEVLETQCGVPPAFREAAAPAGPAEAAVVVDFAGYVEGRFGLAAWGGALDLLAKGFIPEGGPLSDSQKRDVLGELANIICGNALPYVFGPEAVFQLDPPRVENSLPELRGENAASLPLSAGDLRLWVELPSGSKRGA